MREDPNRPSCAELDDVVGTVGVTGQHGREGRPRCILNRLRSACSHRGSSTVRSHVGPESGRESGEEYGVVLERRHEDAIARTEEQLKGDVQRQIALGRHEHALASEWGLQILTRMSRSMCVFTNLELLSIPGCSHRPARRSSCVSRFAKKVLYRVFGVDAASGTPSLDSILYVAPIEHWHVAMRGGKILDRSIDLGSHRPGSGPRS